MTTIVVVRRGLQVAIGADSLVTFGETRLPGHYEANDKLIHVGDSCVGLAGSTAHFEVLRRALPQIDGPAMHTRSQVFDTFLKVHQVLKEQYFLNTKEEDDDPYESSQITALIANPGGIFGVYSYREVFSFERFWAIGSGRNFALGAMHAAWVRPELDAAAIARIGLEAGAEFDRNTAGPFNIITMDCLQSAAATGAST
jgi:ATP-dependent HslUV protease subunit HslV